MSKQVTRYKRNLKRKLKYHGIELPVETAAQRVIARRAVASKKRANSKERFINTLVQKVQIHNDTNQDRNQVLLSRKTLESLSKKRLNEINKGFNLSLKKHKNESLRKTIQKISPKSKSRSRSKTLRGLSTDLENYRRFKDNDLTTLQELYYNNFLRACLRSGSYTLYRASLRKGWSFVNDLYRKGFDIAELYLHIGPETPFFRDSPENVEAYFSGEKKVPQKNTALGSSIQQYAKHIHNLRL